MLLLPSALRQRAGDRGRLGGHVRRRPRAAPARAGRRVPGQPDHRPPRRAADGPAQHRLAAAGLDGARRHVVRRRRPLHAAAGAAPGALLAGHRDRDRPGAGLGRRVGTPGPRGTLVVRVGAVVVAARGSRRWSAPGTSPTCWTAAPRCGSRSASSTAAHGRWLPWAALMAALLALTVRRRGGRRLGGRPGRPSPRPRRAPRRGRRPVRPGRTPAPTCWPWSAPTGPGIWRSVPMRRGMVVLALFPGLVAVGGSFRLGHARHLPGAGRLRRRAAVRGELLVPGRAGGALARQPARSAPGSAFVSRVLVLTEILLAATLVTLLLASLRAGLPTAAAAGRGALRGRRGHGPGGGHLAALVGRAARTPSTCAARGPPRRRRW